MNISYSTMENKKLENRGAIRTLGERYGSKLAILGIAVASQSGCGPIDHPAQSAETTCHAELGTCLTGGSDYTLAKGAYAIVGDVRFVVDDMPVNDNLPAISLTITALSSPYCVADYKVGMHILTEKGYVTNTYVIGSGDDTHYKYSYEKIVTTGVAEQGTPTIIRFSGREYTVNLYGIAGGVATFSVSAACTP